MKNSYDNISWKEEDRKTVLSRPIFSVEDSYCRSPKDKLKTFNVISAGDWAMIIPLIETEEGQKFVMVRQWRHGAKEISLEFPGGVCEEGEDPEKSAVRELKEETGYVPEKIIKLGSFSPNPAIMTNRMHFFLALDLKGPYDQDLDPDEYVEVELLPCEDVIKNMGKPPYINALIGTAMTLFLQYLKQ